MRIFLLAVTFLCGGMALCQPSTGTIKQSGSCNAANSGSNSTVKIICSGVGQEQGDKIIGLLNLVLAKKDLPQIDAKLDELLRIASTPVNIQNCQLGSACAQGPGSQAILNQYGAPKLTMTDAQHDMIRDAMKPYKGMKVDIFFHDATPDSTEFGDRLADALGPNGAGLRVGAASGMAFQSAGVPPGISFEMGEKRVDAATALVKSMVMGGLVKRPIPASRDNQNSERFTIFIAPNR